MSADPRLSALYRDALALYALDLARAGDPVFGPESRALANWSVEHAATAGANAPALPGYRIGSDPVTGLEQA
jgi:hypothetical protein